MGKRKAYLLLVLTLVFSMILSACSGEKSSTEESGGDGPTEIRVMSHFFNPTPPSNDSAVKKEIEKATNSKLNIEWVSANNYTDKLNVMLASGDLPDLMLIPDPFNPVFRKAAEQGAFWDVSPYIKDYPNLNKTIDPIAWDLTKMNGGNFGIPRPRPTDGETFLILRKDWLDHVGLDVPKTSDELYEVMKAFTYGDPDQNGKDDTIGVAGQIDPIGMGSLVNFEGIFTGATGDWKEVNGELVHTATLPEMKEALEFLANAYKEKLIPEDFASLQISQVKEMFQANKAGMISQKTGAMQETYDPLSKIVKDFDFMNLYPLTSVNSYNPKGPGFAGINAIPKSVPEEKMKKILAVLDRWVEEDVFSLHKQGIEGVHHKVENGEVVVDTEKMVEDAVADFNQILYVSDPYASTVKPTFPEEVQKFYAEVQDERAKSSVADVSIGLYSETGQTYLPELTKKIMDLKTKIILGREPLSAWDTFVNDLKADQNFIKLTEEMNQSYKER
ncbi:extracellular solute-binding protein [Metabacillus schmidteae]|uniref:extracellular solute-binding protein n=1 Tax=Metabacillus schmidteae TaxID=2730405 RepID=UPI00158E417C|nr:extracellular solute-binding protein [Metabacillus schmidteae]